MRETPLLTHSYRAKRYVMTRSSAQLGRKDNVSSRSDLAQEHHVADLADSGIGGAGASYSCEIAPKDHATRSWIGCSVLGKELI